jgi:hypothetical protein
MTSGGEEESVGVPAPIFAALGACAAAPGFGERVKGGEPGSQLTSRGRAFPHQVAEMYHA